MKFKRLLMVIFLLLICPILYGQKKEIIEEQIYNLINDYRVKNNLPTLKLLKTVGHQAYLHSKNMAMGTYPFSHQGFKKRAKKIKKHILFTSMAENVSFRHSSTEVAKSMVEGWIKSKSHHKNIIGNFNHTGIGVALKHDGYYYATQIFIQIE